MQCLQLTGLFQYAIRQAAESENYFTSIERIHAFATLPSEGAATTRATAGNALAPDWPQHGRIEYSHVYMAYREDLPFALMDLTFTVSGGGCE